MVCQNHKSKTTLELNKEKEKKKKAKTPLFTNLFNLHRSFISLFLLLKRLN